LAKTSRFGQPHILVILRPAEGGVPPPYLGRQHEMDRLNDAPCPPVATSVSDRENAKEGTSGLLRSEFVNASTLAQEHEGLEAVIRDGLREGQVWAKKRLQDRHAAVRMIPAQVDVTPHFSAPLIL